LFRAAAKAGVAYIVPNAYGVNIYGNDKLQNDIPALKEILASVREIEEIGSNWIAIKPNFWYEYSMGVGPFAFEFDFPKSVTFYDDGKSKVKTTTWPQTGRASAALVNLKKLPEDEDDKSITLTQLQNKPLYISSFTLNQRDHIHLEDGFGTIR
jgi:hypothetical protein